MDKSECDAAEIARRIEDDGADPFVLDVRREGDFKEWQIPGSTSIGAEQNVVSVLSRDVLGVESMLVIASFVVNFGFVKVLLDLYGKKWSETYGRRPILVAGWFVALPTSIR